MNKFKYILFVVFAVFSVSFGNAQQLLFEAQEAYQSGDLKLAKVKITEFFKDSVNVKNTDGYYFKGYVYKDSYKKNPVEDENFAMRITALEAFKLAYDLDSTAKYKSDIQKNIKFLILNFYNEGILRAVALDFSQNKMLEEEIAKYEPYTGLSPSMLVEIRYEYTMAMGDAYIRISEKKENKDNKSKLLDSALVLYQKVVKVKPDDYDVNYHIGLVYYNQAVDVINDYDGLVTIEELQRIEHKTNKLFRDALPYMEQAYELNPTNKNVIEALGGIHFSLKNFDKSDEFMKKIDN